MCKDCERSPALSFIGLSLPEDASERTRAALVPYNEVAAKVLSFMEARAASSELASVAVEMIEQMEDGFVADFVDSLTEEERRELLVAVLDQRLVDASLDVQEAITGSPHMHHMMAVYEIGPDGQLVQVDVPNQPYSNN